MKSFRSSLPELPDSFILIFRGYDIFVSLLLLIPLVLCIIAATDGVLSGDIPSILFSVAFVAVACYLALMIYGFSLDFRSCDFDGLEVSGGHASFLLRREAKKEIPLDELDSVELVRIRLFLPYAYYAEFRSKGMKAVAEITEKDVEALEEALEESGLHPAPGREIPFYMSSKPFRR